MSPVEMMARHIARIYAPVDTYPPCMDQVIEWSAPPEVMAAAIFDYVYTLGAPICDERGHDYSWKVTSTKNMYLCFRCGEPGWEV